MPFVPGSGFLSYFFQTTDVMKRTFPDSRYNFAVNIEIRKSEQDNSPWFLRRQWLGIRYRIFSPFIPPEWLVYFTLGKKLKTFKHLKVLLSTIRMPKSFSSIREIEV